MSAQAWYRTALVLLLMLSGLLWTAQSRAACSVYADRATFNEYYFGNAGANFLEVYINNTVDVPRTEWQNWFIRVYTAPGAFTDHVLNDTTATYCEFGSRAYATLEVPGGLPSPDISVALFDASGNEIDYLDACGPPGSCPLPGYYTPEAGMCASVDHDLQLGSLGNRDISRFPDGSGDWAISSGSGAGTAFTNCEINNAGVSKLASTAAVIIGNDFTFDIEALNNGKQAANFTIEDTLTAGFTYVSSTATQGTIDATALPTLTWDVGSLAKDGGSALWTITVTGSVLGSHTNTAIVTTPCDDPANCPSDSSTVLVEPPPIDHYDISYPNGNPGITCEALAVRVEAHSSSHAPVAPTAGTAITLSTAPAADGWALKAGNGTFSAPGQYSFDGTETFAELWLTETTVTTAPYIDIDVTDGGATDIDGDTTEDANAQFDDAIFRFFAAGAPETIGTQIAGKASNSAPGNQMLQLRAVKASTTTAECEAALTGTMAVDIAYECNNPASCSAGNLLSMSTAADTQTIARNNNGSVVSYTALNMNFDASGIAPFDITFSDAGAITLRARKTLSAGSGSPPSTADTLIGASNSFVVRPFGFDVDFSGDRASNGITGPSYAADENGSRFQVAGTVFPATLRAVLWNASDDTDNSGAPDACVDLTDNAATPNFGNETTAVAPADVMLGNTLMAPAAGVAGTITVDSSGAAFAGGVGTQSIIWDEVGIINLDATLNNYLSSSENVLGNVCNVGRFIPNHFVLASATLTNRSDSVACPDPFTYMGENFQIDYELAAFNARSPATLTQNYSGAFAKLDLSVPAEMNYGATDAGSNLTARLGVASAGGFTAGTAAVSATLQLARIAVPDGVHSNFQVGIMPTDSDGVSLLTADLNLALDGGADSHVQLGQTDLRYGRLNLYNNFGSELLGLSLPLNAEYYLDATAEFVINADDSCTTRAPANVLLYNSLQPKAARAVGDSVINIGTGSTTLTSISAFVGGRASLTFTAPAAEGYVDVEIQAPDWLLSNLDELDQGIEGPGGHCTPGIAASDPAFITGCTADGDSIDDVPLSRANFGIFKGSDNIIYIREAY